MGGTRLKNSLQVEFDVFRCSKSASYRHDISRIMALDGARYYLSVIMPLFCLEGGRSVSWLFLFGLA
jgi:hypothetical protein